MVFTINYFIISKRRRYAIVRVTLASDLERKRQPDCLSKVVELFVIPELTVSISAKYS